MILSLYRAGGYWLIMKRKGSPKKERASALLTALFIIVIVALLATSTAYKFRLIAHLAGLNNTANQLTLYVKGLSAQAQIAINNYSNDWQHPSNQSHFLVMPSFIGPTILEGTTLTAHIIDGASLFNINNLAYPNTQQGFINLLKYVIPTLSPEEDMRLTNNITDWLLPSTNNNVDQLYANYTPPYRAAHQAMLDISELRQVAGITPAIFNAITPYITALPTAQPGIGTQAAGQPTIININTASVPVLLTTSSQMTIQQAEQLYNCRQEHGIFLSMSDFTSACSSQNNSASTTSLGVYSNYFLIYSTATHNDQRTSMITLISTHQNNGSHLKQSYIIWQMQR